MSANTPENNDGVQQRVTADAQATAPIASENAAATAALQQNQPQPVQLPPRAPGYPPQADSGATPPAGPRGVTA